MTGKRKRLLGWGIVATTVFVAGCASLPEPADPEYGLLVIPVRHENETGREYFGHYKLAVKGAARRYTHDMLVPERTMVVVQLPPGRYTIETIFWYKDAEQWPHVVTIESALVRPGRITINDQYALVALVEEDGQYSMPQRWMPTPSQMRAEYTDRLRRARNSELWEF